MIVKYEVERSENKCSSSSFKDHRMHTYVFEKNLFYCSLNNDEEEILSL